MDVLECLSDTQVAVQLHLLAVINFCQFRLGQLIIFLLMWKLYLSEVFRVLFCVIFPDILFSLHSEKGKIGEHAFYTLCQEKTFSSPVCKLYVLCVTTSISAPTLCRVARINSQKSWMKAKVSWWLYSKHHHIILWSSALLGIVAAECNSLL